MSNSKFQRDALPTNSMERNASLAIRPLGALLVVLLVAYGWAVYSAPTVSYTHLTLPTKA